MPNLNTLLNRMEAAGNTASVGGQQVPRRYFAYVGDPTKPSTWKLPCQDANHTRNAMSRFSQTEIPASAKAHVKSFILRRAKHFGIDTTNFEKE